MNMIEEKNILPLIPLRETVLFPYMSLPIIIGRGKSVTAINAGIANGGRIILVCQKNPEIEEPLAKDLYRVGVIAKVMDITPDGKQPLQAFVEVESIVEIKNIIDDKSFLNAQYEIPNIPESVSSLEIEAMARTLREKFQELVFIGKSLPLEMTVGAMRDHITPERLSYLLPQILNLSIDQKQEILETYSVSKRLDLIMKYLANELEVISVQEKVKRNTSDQLSKLQREVILREQLKAIEKELGMDDQDEYSEIEKKIASAKMPPVVDAKAKNELGRLKKMTSASPESSYIRTYLEWLADLPWSKKSTSQIDLAKAEKILDNDHFGLEKVKERILEHLAVQKLSKKMKGPILCFVGPPGVGKTSIGNSIAKALNRQFIRISLGGIRDEAEIRGHRRTYVGAMPGRIIQGIKNAKTKNPVFMLDEIDKIGSDYRGDPSSALLEALDPEQNFQFSDHYLEVAFDLSDVLFITTANTLDTIPPALRDRLEIIEFRGYTIYEKESIAKNYLWPKVLESHGLDLKTKLEEDALHFLITKYTREAGVRNLERQLSTIARKIAREVVSGKKALKKIENSFVRKSLGPEQYPEILSQTKDEVGISTGLAWTQAGGEILFIEATFIPGKGLLTLTGQLGDVMKESAHAALSYLRSRAMDLGIDENFFEKKDIHVHVPAGAIPKDGPSAGIAIATAIASSILGKPIKKEIGMTGEITIRGKVLEIGGIKEKLIAASRAGVKEVIIPKDNEKNLEDVPPEVMKSLKIHYVSEMDQVLPIALKVQPNKKNSGSRQGAISSAVIA